MLPKSLIQLLEKHRDKIEGPIEDETDTGDGYWVHLRPGWYWDDIGLHIIHEDTAQKVVKAFRYVRPCTCDSCKRATGT